MKLPNHFGAIALVGLLAGASPIATLAQTQQNVPPAEQVTGDEVDAFVVAYNDVQAIDAEYSNQMSQTTDRTELQDLLEEAQVKKTEAVEATPGINVDRFVEILTIAQTDPDLNAQIMEKLN